MFGVRIPFVENFFFFFYISYVPLQTERTYFQVFLPKEAKDASLPMFFCSKWSVGKVVDFAASLAKLKNNNNILTAKVLVLTYCTRCSLLLSIFKYIFSIFSACS